MEEITITFHNRGLRSFIEVDLCARCPRLDDKGCCGYYSPVFYPTDLAFIMQEAPDFIDHLFSIRDTTILDASVTVNNTIEGNSYRCHFHSRDKGCLLPQNLRESVCRHFVCPGVGWEKEETLQYWSLFFTRLSDYEIELNNRIAEQLKQAGLTLRDQAARNVVLQEIKYRSEEETRQLPTFFAEYPICETVKITRKIKYGNDWPL